MIRKGKGFTLIEVIISVGILGLASSVFISSLYFSGKIARNTTLRVVARNIARGIAEEIRADNYDNVTTANYCDIPSSSPDAYYIDEEMNIKCDVTIDIKGLGQVSGAAWDTLRDSAASWQPNEWQGNVVFITNGQGRGQRALITSNTPDTLNVTLDLSGNSSENWTILPNTTSEYAINGGKTVVITVTYQYRDRSYQETLTLLKIRYV